MPDASVQRELELARARERHGQEQLALVERRLAAAETASAVRGAHAVDLDLALRETTAERDRLHAQVAELRRINAELAATAEHFRTVNDGLTSSLSWRVTRPLRAVRRHGQS